MSWEKNLFERLELNNLVNKKIVLDIYGLSKEDDFRDYIKKRGLSCYFVNNVDEIIDNFDEFNLFFLYNVNEHQLPYYIKSRFDIILLDSKLCFCEMDNNIVASKSKNLSKRDFRKVLIYSLSEGKYIYINENNINEILNKAEKFYLKSRINILKKRINEIVNMDSVTKHHIFKVAELYSELVWCFFKLKISPPTEIAEKTDKLLEKFILFGDYKESFFGLFNTINRVVHEIKNRNPNKFALICFDGMGIIEWNILKEYFARHNITIKDERFIFTLIPTATFNCRTSLFSGKIEECYFGIIDENKEFVNAFSETHKVYILKPDKIINEFFEDRSAVKIVYNFFDDNSHAYVFSNKEEEDKNMFLESLSRQINVSNIANEIVYLLEQDFSVFISSDHGCVVSRGNGIRIDKYLIEEKCGRGILAENSSLIEKYKDLAMILDLPFVSNFKAVVAKNRESFYAKDKLEITHGGISIEEIIVPFAEIKNDRF